jgi:DNA-3-methyladenine glycosylase
MSRLPRSFYARHPLVVARDLLGCRLVRVWGSQSQAEQFEPDGVARRLSGYIVEVEAYTGIDDAASHARRGPTKRNAPMFGVPGHAYVYFVYGMHWMFNVVAREDGPGAVLVRALVPDQGLDVMRTNRGGRSDRLLASGPARLTQAMAIDGLLNGVDLCTHPGIFIESGRSVPEEAVVRGPRVGVTGDELARTRPWRLWVKRDG